MGASFQMGEIRQIFIYLYVYTFFRNSHTAQTPRRISARDAAFDAVSHVRGTIQGPTRQKQHKSLKGNVIQQNIGTQSISLFMIFLLFLMC